MQLGNRQLVPPYLCWPRFSWLILFTCIRPKLFPSMYLLFCTHLLFPLAAHSHHLLCENLPFRFHSHSIPSSFRFLYYGNITVTIYSIYIPHNVVYLSLLRTREISINLFILSLELKHSRQDIILGNLFALSPAWSHSSCSGATRTAHNTIVVSSTSCTMVT